ncbi:hypothetical protein LCGC14_1026750 [marine sediment metagenome]|uniref:Uncharacterized protein n=1 Tax=marine sediment metagenome TaxID=412755 RepID=A0A0F9MVU6_9ZZZZ|nr:hypothetical protein [Candidatus Aminicenantes bacterium]
MVDDTSKIGRAIVRDFGDFIFTRSQDNIVSMGISDTGALLISGDIRDEGEKTIIEYTAPYAAAVNDGTDKHFVDPEELLGWVKRKLGVPEEDVQKRAGEIADKIAKFGTKPQPFMDAAISVAKEKYKGHLDFT